MYSQKIKQYLRHVRLGDSTRPKGHYQTLALKGPFSTKGPWHLMFSCSTDSKGPF